MAWEKIYVPFVVALGVLCGIFLFLFGYHRINPNKTKFKFVGDTLLIATATIFILLSITYSQKKSFSQDKEQTTSVTEDEIKSLIKKLGSEDFGEREKATERLIEIGEKARKYLKEAEGSQDAEVVSRVKIILEKIERKLYPLSDIKDLWQKLNESWTNKREPELENLENDLTSMFKNIKKERNISDKVEVLIKKIISERREHLAMSFGSVECYEPSIEGAGYQVAMDNLEKQWVELQKLAKENKLNREVVGKAEEYVIENLKKAGHAKDADEKSIDELVETLFELNLGKTYVELKYSDELSKLSNIWDTLNEGWNKKRQTGLSENLDLTLKEAINIIDKKRNLPRSVEELIAFIIQSRNAHINRTYASATCYRMISEGVERRASLNALENRWQELQKIAGEDKLDTEAIKKIKLDIINNFEKLIEIEQKEFKAEDISDAAEILIEMGLKK